MAATVRETIPFNLNFNQRFGVRQLLNEIIV